MEFLLPTLFLSNLIVLFPEASQTALSGNTRLLCKHKLRSAKTNFSLPEPNHLDHRDGNNAQSKVLQANLSKVLLSQMLQQSTQW